MNPSNVVDHLVWFSLRSMDHGNRPKGFTRAGDETSCHLYVANCGPTVGISFDAIKTAFKTFGLVTGVQPADASGTRVIVSYSEENAAREALKAWNGRSCPDFSGRVLHIRYSVRRSPCKVSDSIPISLEAFELGVPGLRLMHDFISDEEEQQWTVDLGRSWQSEEFSTTVMSSTMMNVDAKQFLGKLPTFVSRILEKVATFPDLSEDDRVNVDQLTVNEYPPGVGLSPHVDTHSAFDGPIFSLSLAGPCIMELRKYSQATWVPPREGSKQMEKDGIDCTSNSIRRAIFLPSRSMLLLSGEARYAWHHYIPHRKVDIVDSNKIKRGSRRVSFTFRKVRRGPCRCEFKEYCDSQRGNSEYVK
ncbi:alkylated DNA repair protein alkB homolog 8 isoform X2 [Amborella trichopoda]|uniref:alkylated DNA repair protein alkB homolog 8 isoform X2 n=1 Tax=Amborella trichopoda TaxID=13333 RepID=UPI0009C00507|nr:alkylated DNA repair protein alkB homolog 8 isoform X2 [Amborella trichopoda]|eukprot:XP_020524322.1 alkylated DNA repair protein alkB homolog 8 isoform X2 [Amborella trichopoda]